MAKNKQPQTTQTDKKGFLKSFKKNVPSLEFYDAGAMFIAQFVLQYLLQLVLMLLAYSILAYRLDVNMASTEGMDAIVNEFTLFTMSTGGIILITLINESTMILSPLCYWKIKSYNVFKGVGFKRKVNGWQIAMTLPISIGLLAGFMPVASLFVYLVELTGYNYTGANIVVDSFGKLALYLIFIAAIPAVCEELLHRGMIARGGSRISFVAGLLLSSSLFALMHGSPIQLVHQFFVGVVCCLVYYMTGSIWISVLTHFFNNAITLVSGYIIYLITGSTDLAMPWWAMLIMCVCGIAMLTGSLFVMYKICYAKRQKEDADLDLDAQKEENFAGKRRLIKLFNDRMAYLFKSPEQVLQEREQSQKVDEELAGFSEEKKEVYSSLRQDDKVQLKKKNSRAIIFAFVVVIIIWIINTIGGYTQ